MPSRVPAAHFELRAGYSPAATTSPHPLRLSSAPAIQLPLLESPRFPRCVFTAGVLRNLGPALVQGGGTGAQPWSDCPPPCPRDLQLLWDPSLGPWALLPRGPSFQLHLQLLAHLLCCDRFQSQQDFSQKIQPPIQILSLSRECILERKKKGMEAQRRQELERKPLPALSPAQSGKRNPRHLS